MNKLEPGNRTEWVPVVRVAYEHAPGLLVEEGCAWPAPPRVCLEVRPDGMLVIGEPDPEQDARMFELLLVGRCGEA